MNAHAVEVARADAAMLARLRSVEDRDADEVDQLQHSLRVAAQVARARAAREAFEVERQSR